MGNTKTPPKWAVFVPSPLDMARYIHICDYFAFILCFVQNVEICWASFRTSSAVLEGCTFTTLPSWVMYAFMTILLIVGA